MKVTPLPAIVAAILFAVVHVHCSHAQTRDAGGQSGANGPGGAKELKAAGPAVRITLYPVHVLGRADRNVANVLGLVLESYGMENVDAVDAAFAPTAGSSWEDTAKGFAEFVKQSSPGSAYALYAEFLGDPQRGPTEVRWVIVDGGGHVLVTDRQTPADSDFKRTTSSQPDPMGCSVLVAERMFSQLHWSKNRGPAKADGKFARLWAEKSGTPDANERAAMERRAGQLAGALKTARIGVYATRVGNDTDGQSAARLAKLLSQRLGCQAKVIDRPMTTPIAATSNEQKRLWDLARAFREHLRADRPGTEYAVLAEFLLEPSGGKAHSVHVVVCDASGEWVVVDFQNNQQEDFRRVAPKGVEDCERLAVERVGRVAK